ncbi:NAD-dependent epimerase/dehydratase family protein [Salipaludibacillus sp. HK11]|uniref:NAD-dependent epimerase/dehydratase family protein n=1 Tax=Salipaludibacillus sp. HK11 TaxID=3394320 RepID=UPI0039FDD83A
MRILVTGAGGFIGSSLCEELLKNPDVDVTGIDFFLGHTKKSIAKRNIIDLLKHPRFQFIEKNLLQLDDFKLLKNIDYVYHLAGIPGVRSSWGEDFKKYADHNIIMTQRLLEACRIYPVRKFIFASTSSVYGEQKGMVSERVQTKPLSPYGMTKLACEHLCHIYNKNFQIPTVILRYFTVYGPKQRTDMAFHKFIKSILEDKPIVIYGDGKQTRDFTYIDDCTKATASVVFANNVIGETINIGGKERASVLEIINILEEIFNKQIIITHHAESKGEPKHTWADISKAQLLLNYSPQVPLKDGIKQEVDYIKYLY